MRALLNHSCGGEDCKFLNGSPSGGLRGFMPSRIEDRTLPHPSIASTNSETNACRRFCGVHNLENSGSVRWLNIKTQSAWLAVNSAGIAPEISLAILLLSDFWLSPLRTQSRELKNPLPFVSITLQVENEHYRRVEFL